MHSRPQSNLMCLPCSFPLVDPTVPSECPHGQGVALHEQSISDASITGAHIRTRYTLVGGKLLYIPR